MDEENLAFTSQTFELIDENFRKIIMELAADPALDRFRIEYEKLHKALKNSYQNENKQLQKFKELNNDIIVNATKVQAALKLTQEDSNTIANLKAELEKTYRVLEISREREEKSKKKIENLHQEIKHLTALNENGSLLQTQSTESIERQQVKVDELTKSKEQLMVQLDSKKKEIKEFIDLQRNVENEKVSLELRIKEEAKSLKEVQEVVTKDEDRRKKIQQELSTLKENYIKEQQAKDRQDTKINNLKNGNNQKKSEYDLKKEEYEEKSKELQKLQKEIVDLTSDVRRFYEMKEENENVKKSIQEQIKINENQKQKFISEKGQLEKSNNKVANEKQNLQLKLTEVQKNKEMAINSVNQLERQVNDSRKHNAEDNQYLDELNKAKIQLEKNLKHCEDKRKQQQRLIQQKEDHIKTVQNDIQKKIKTLEELQKSIKTLEKEKEKYGKDAAKANHKYFQSLEEIKLKTNKISELQKKNIETENKLKKQQGLYETVRSDRNLYSKNLSETLDEIAEIKKRNKIVNHQINQLKEEIEAKEVALGKEQFEHKKKDKRIEEFSRILEQKKKAIEIMEEKIKNHVGEISKLHYIIKDSENQRQDLKQKYELVVATRDIYGTQLIRRNDEAALLYEKIKIQQKTLSAGQAAYREKEGDIQLLTYKIRDLQRSLAIYRKQVANIKPLTEQIRQHQDELIEQKLRVKALSEELENPLNEHRCRKLEGDDPDVHEMVQKQTILQRRLISKTEQVVEKEVMIQQKEKQIQELREIMKRQPGIEEAKKISSLQQTLKQKTRQMKALAAELNMHSAQIKQYKYEIDKIQKDILETKRKYYEQRKREQLEKEMEQQQQQQ